MVVVARGLVSAALKESQLTAFRGCRAPAFTMLAVHTTALVAHMVSCLTHQASVI
jgi:hypothetical protein